MLGRLKSGLVSGIVALSGCGSEAPDGQTTPEPATGGSAGATGVEPRDDCPGECSLDAVATCSDGLQERCGRATPNACNAFEDVTCSSGRCYDEARCLHMSHVQWGSDRTDLTAGLAPGEGGTFYSVSSTAVSLPTSVQGRPLGQAILFKWGAEGDLLSVTPWGPEDATSYGRGVASGALGHVYSSGATGGAIPGATNAGSLDILLGCFDADGQLLWQRQWGSGGSDEAPAVAVTPDGDVVLGGFMMNAEVAELGGEYDAFLWRYSPSGEQHWQRAVGTAGEDQILAVAVDEAGNVFAAGSTTGAFDGHTNGGQTDAFVGRWSGDGELVWVRQWGEEQRDHAAGLLVRDGRVYVAATLGVSGAAGAEPRQAFVGAWDVDGNVLWQERFGSSQGTGVSTLGWTLDGRLVVGGTTHGSLEEPPLDPHRGQSDALLVFFAADGTRQDSISWGSTSFDGLSHLAVRSDGAIVTGGNTQGEIQEGFFGSGTPSPFITTVRIE